MGCNKKLYGYYKTGNKWLPILVSLGGSIIIAEVPDHADKHQDGGSDEIIVTGLSGLLGDSQTPLEHDVSHQNGGSDEIIVTGLSGLLADSQTPLGHHISHETGGSDIIDGVIRYADTRSKIISATRDLASASGDVSYTGVGFTPTSIHALATVPFTAYTSHGFSDVSKSSGGIFGYDGAGKYTHATLLIYFRISGGNTQYAIVKTYDVDGFTLTWTKTGTPTGTATIKFLCLR